MKTYQVTWIAVVEVENDATDQEVASESLALLQMYDRQAGFEPAAIELIDSDGETIE